MKHRIAFSLIILISLAFTGLAAAQDSPTWRAVLLRSDADAHELVVVTDSGIGQPIPLAKSFAVGLDAPKLSPDGRFAVTLAPSRDSIQITDLQAGTCCQTLQFADSAATQASIAGFSPDSKQVAVAYLIEKPYTAELVALDLDSGKATRYDAAPSAPSGGGVVDYPVADSWREDGVYFTMSCIYCVENTSTYALLSWEPSTGAVTPSSLSLNGLGDILALTGEQIAPQQSPLYPTGETETGPHSDGLPGSYNVVVLTGKRAADGRAVVYFDPDNLKLASTRWVADGNGFLAFPVSGQGQTMLITADAPPAPVALDAHQFLTGTPDGWLSLESGTIYHYSVADGQVTRAGMGKLDGVVTPVESTSLGTTANAVFAPIEPPRPEACPGGKTPRLTVGHTGRVTPGAANNIREEPTTSSRIVGKIAGGETFTVIAGPACSQGLTWWQVEYRNFTGWTAESNEAQYWVEPGP